MSTKQTALLNTNSCLSKAAPDEPVFVLRANDPLFAQTVRLWAAMAVGEHEPGKIDEALTIAEVGRLWRENRPVAPVANQARALTKEDFMRDLQSGQQNRGVLHPNHIKGTSPYL